MNFRFFFTIMTLTAIHKSFSMTLNEQKNLNFQLLWAAGRGDTLEVASLVQCGAEINARVNNDCTPLHEAAFHGHTATVELLLSKGADSNAKNHFSATPLHLAGDTATAKLLLSHDADIDAKDNSGNTPLHCAAFNGHTAIAELLLSRSADINAKDGCDTTPLLCASLNRHAATVELLLSKGADINAKGGYYGKTPLHEAVDIGDPVTVKLLLSHGADINAKYFAVTPLYMAALHDNKTIVKLLKTYELLLERTKNPTKQLLRVAIEHGYYGLVKLVLQHVTPDGSDLQLAKVTCQTAEYEQSYKAIGRLLVAHLQLLGVLKTPEKSKKNQAMGSLKRLMAYFRLSTPGASSMQGPISKAGIGLPENIMRNIATFIE